jgi:hypothetical protein
MKNALLGIAILALIGSACGPTHVVVQTENPAPPPPPPPAEEISYQSFYDELSPYGHWIDYPGYGYVWMPNAGPDFKPYATNGHWVYTDAGWAWASDYNWGWAPFHYGRWFYDDSYGWMWIPGREWAPAWVSWRTNSDYYGWAPLGPNVGGSGMEVNVSAGAYNPPPRYWCFVPHQYVYSPQVNNYYVNESRNVTIVNNTTVINNTTIINNNSSTVNNYRNTYRSGPDPREVERNTGTTVRPYTLRQAASPGGAQVANGQMAIYRPRGNSPQAGGNNSSAQRPAPARVENLRDIRPVSATRNNGFQPNENPSTNRGAVSNSAQGALGNSANNPNRNNTAEPNNATGTGNNQFRNNTPANPPANATNNSLRNNNNANNAATNNAAASGNNQFRNNNPSNPPGSAGNPASNSSRNNGQSSAKPGGPGPSPAGNGSSPTPAGDSRNVRPANRPPANNPNNGNAAQGTAPVNNRPNPAQAQNRNPGQAGSQPANNNNAFRPGQGQTPAKTGVQPAKPKPQDTKVKPDQNHNQDKDKKDNKDNKDNKNQ